MRKLLLILFCTFAFAVSVSAQLLLGNPNGSTKNEANPNNYLVTHTNYILSYNRSRGAANWVFWHVEKRDLGAVKRTNDFRADPLLPKEWQIPGNVFETKKTGVDQGHMCPAGDRSNSKENISETFLMSNMAAQVSRVNRTPWRLLEEEIRTLVNKGTEAYIFAGCYGKKTTIVGGKVTVPTNCFKIILFIPAGDGDDVKRINKSSTIIAVIMPNEKTISSKWRDYIKTVDNIETATRFDFLDVLPDDVEKALEAKKFVNQD